MLASVPHFFHMLKLYKIGILKLINFFKNFFKSESVDPSQTKNGI